MLDFAKIAEINREMDKNFLAYKDYIMEKFQVKINIRPGKHFMDMAKNKTNLLRMRKEFIMDNIDAYVMLQYMINYPYDVYSDFLVKSEIEKLEIFEEFSEIPNYRQWLQNHKVEMVKLIINTDGASNKKGNGGAGVVINMIMESGEEIELLAYQIASDKTTNNQMEIFSAMTAFKFSHMFFKDGLLDALIESVDEDGDFPKCVISSIEVLSDSEYTVKGYNQWMKGWQSKGWMNTSGVVKNQGLWKNFIKLKALITKDQVPITLRWSRGHDGAKYNEIADIIAGDAYKSEHYKHETQLFEEYDEDDLIATVNHDYSKIATKNKEEFEGFEPAIFLGCYVFNNFDSFANNEKDIASLLSSFSE